MSRVVIVGGGDFARELHDWLIDDDPTLNQECIGFIDDDSHALERHSRLEGKYLGSIREFFPRETDRLFMGVSSPSTKRSLVGLLRERGAACQTFVHRSAVLSTSCVIGQGSVICPKVVVSSDASIGAFVTVNIAASVGHDATVGDFSSLMSFVDVTGWVRIEEACFLGSHASILPGVTVEGESIVGAGSVAIRRVKRHSTVFGVPARPLRTRTEPS